MLIALRIVDHMAERRWTAYRLAREARISQTLAYRLVRRRGHFRRLDHDTLVKLCVAFDCQPGEMFRWERPKRR